MPHVLAEDDLLEVAILSSCSNQLGANVRHYRCVAITGTSVTDQDAANHLSPYFATDYQGLMNTDATFLGVKVQVIKPQRFQPVFSTINSGPGTGGPDPLPLQTAGLVTLRTAVADRRSRGRFYMMFPAESMSEGNAKPSSIYLALLDVLATRMVTEVTVGTAPNQCGLRPVVFSRVLQTAKDVTDYTVRRNWATMRSRSQIGKGDFFPI